MTGHYILIGACLLAMAWLYRSLRHSYRVEAAMADWYEHKGYGKHELEVIRLMVDRHGKRATMDALERITE